MRAFVLGLVLVFAPAGWAKGRCISGDAAAAALHARGLAEAEAISNALAKRGWTPVRAEIVVRMPRGVHRVGEIVEIPRGPGAPERFLLLALTEARAGLESVFARDAEGRVARVDVSQSLRATGAALLCGCPPVRGGGAHMPPVWFGLRLAGPAAPTLLTEPLQLKVEVHAQRIRYSRTRCPVPP